MRSLERRAIGVARRQQQDDTSSDDADTSGNESDNSVDSSDDEADVKPTQTIRTPVVSATVAVRAGKLAALPTARAETAVGVTLSAEEPGKVELDSDSDGIDSDSDESGDETTAPPGTPTPPPAANPPPPQPTVTEPASTSAIRAPPPPASSTVHPDHHKSKLQPPSQPEETSTRFSTSTIVPLPVTSAKSSSSIDDILTSIAGIAPTQLTTLSLASVASTSTGASPTLPATGSAQSGDSEGADPQANEREGEGLGVVSTPQKKLSSGAVAGIVVGVLGVSHPLTKANCLNVLTRPSRGCHTRHCNIILASPPPRRGPSFLALHTRQRGNRRLVCARHRRPPTWPGRWACA